MKQQLRRLKLWEMGIGEWSYATSYEKMKEVIDKNLDGCVIKTTDEYPNSYLFTQGDRYVMEQDQKNDHLWVRWDGLWSIFSNDFCLEYEDIQAIIKFMVEQHLRSKVGTPKPLLKEVPEQVEQHLRSKVETPRISATLDSYGVEQHLRSKVGTPERCTFQHQIRWNNISDQR